MAKRKIDLDSLTDEELLGLRFCDLDLRIQGTPLEGYIEQLYRELAERGISFRPDFYLADEWLCPDGEPVIGIAFFLAHPRLRKLEQKMMMEAEGGDKDSCMKLLRHETGHAVNYAYLLYRRKRWQDVFGPFTAEYPETYRYRPYSKSFVRHLEDWYAQYHPDEDFAETFAVWLDPSSDWRDRYKGWKALRKLEYIDSVMEEISRKSPRKPKGNKYWMVSRMKSTLGTYYRRKKKLYAQDYTDFHDFHIHKIFPREGSAGKRQKAYRLIRQHRKEILDHVALWSGERKYLINELLKDLIARCRELGLYAGTDEMLDVMKVSIYVTAQTMNHVYSGRYKSRNEKVKNIGTV